MESYYYVYILECSDGTYYVGITNNVEKRIAAHNEGRGAKYTRGRTPVRLCYRERFHNRSEASRREHQLKKLTRPAKERLIKENRSC